MSIDQKFEKIITLLIVATKSNRLQWSTTPDEETFRATLPQSVVRVTRIPQGSDGDDGGTALRESYTLSLLNEEGRVVEELCLPDPSESQQLGVLYSLARRSALGTDEFLTGVLDELTRVVARTPELTVGHVQNMPRGEK